MEQGVCRGIFDVFHREMKTARKFAGLLNIKLRQMRLLSKQWADCVESCDGITRMTASCLAGAWALDKRVMGIGKVTSLCWNSI